ncbi:MAG: hypothetical protein GX620_11410 [Chloroflexi bacterium]|nr:hypothetical protein [Chloroflexota bacterium]
MSQAMTMRDRMLALIQGRELDRVPFVMYDIMAPPRLVDELLGPGRMGLLRWCPISRAEYPSCRLESESHYEREFRVERNTVHTPVGSISETKVFEPALNSGAIREHFIKTREDYEVLWYYLNDAVILDNYEQYRIDAAELGDNGWPLASVERTPWQQLWVEWVGLETLAVHTVDYPEHVARTIEMLTKRARQVFEIAYRSPAPFVDFPDNMTLPAIGRRRFRDYAAPLYDELSEMLAERKAVTFCHMDGDLKGLADDIARCKIGGLDSYSPPPDNDMPVADAVTLWPEKRLWMNFPSSVHLRTPAVVRAAADEILQIAGHTGRLWIQISEDVPPGRWRVTFPIIDEAIRDFGRP